MTNTFDAQDMRNNPMSMLGSADMCGDTCGGSLDWTHGSEGLRRTQSKFPEASGSLLTRVIEGEIIPRLLLAHSQFAVERLACPANEEFSGIISSASFARLVLASEPEEILAHVETLLERGISMERIFLEVLAPVARKLGELWQEDYCTFVDVAIGLSRLHRVLHTIGRRNAGSPQRPSKYRAFFAPVPGEKHTFGVSMLTEFFLHAGWETSCDHEPSTASVVQIAATQRLDVIGFSVSCQELLDPLSELIDKTREASCNRDVAIMVGGGLFIDRFDLAAKFGNAAIVADGIHAVQVAEEIVSRIRHTDEARKIV